MYYLHDLINHGVEKSIVMIRSDITKQNIKSGYYRNLLDILPKSSYDASYSDASNIDSYYSSTFSIGKSIYLNDPTYFNLRRSNLERQISNFDHENLKKKTAFDILKIYIDIIQQNKRIKIAKESLMLQKRLHEQMLIQYESRKKTIYDVQQSQIDTLNTHIQVIELENALFQQRENLFFLIKMDDKGYPLEEYDFSILYEEKNDIDTYSNLSIKSSEISLHIDKLNLTQQYLSLYPSLSVGFNWSRGAMDHEINEVFYKNENYHDNHTFSINLSYPLFNHFQQGINYRMTKRTHALKKLELDNSTSDLKIQIKILETDLIKLKNTYDLYLKRRDLARVGLSIAEERFSLGIINYLDLDNARIQYLNAEESVLNRFYDVIKKQEELNFLTSKSILGIW